MPDDSLKIVLEGEAAQLFQEFEKLFRKMEQLRGGGGKAADGIGKMTKAEKEFARETKKAFDEIQGPQERYNQRQKALNALLKQGKINQTEFATATRRAKERLDAAGRSGQQAFGARALGDLKSYALGMLSISGGIGLITSAFSQLREERKAMADEQAEASLSAGALAQLAGGDARKTAQFQAAGLEIYAAGGAKTPEEAFNVAFNLQSAGALGQRGFVSRLAAIAGQEGVVGLVGEAGKLQTAYGVAETGDYTQIFSKATGAAAPLPKVGISEILQATTKAAGSGKALGLSDEELFAAVSRVSGTYTPDEASTAVSRMLDQLAVKRPEFKGKGLVNVMRTLEGEGMTEAQLKTLLEVRGVRAYRILKDIPALQETLATVEQAQRDQAIMGVATAGEQSPMVYAARQRRIEEAREWGQRLPEAMRANLAEAQKTRARRYWRESGVPELGLYIERAAWAADEFVSGPDAIRGRINEMIPAGERAEWRAKWDKVDQAAESLKNAAVELQKAGRASPVTISDE